MDGYAPAYVAHNVPLLVVSGLSSHSAEGTRQTDTGIQLSSEIPPVQSEDAAVLLRHFKDNDASGLAWNAQEYSGRNRFRVKVIGRDYILPLRNAELPPSMQAISPISKPILHSTLSPLSPSSDLFPDGLLDSRWIEKHNNLVPSAYLIFHTFTSDVKLSTLHDNQLKTDINHIKNVLNQSGYKTRLTVALLSERSITKSPDVEERLSNIRKATGLDSKTSFFFLPPQSSAVELQAFVETIISTIYPISIEYYRDLSKHSRRKRNRGVIPLPTVPPTSGTSQTLPSQGWNVRYDFKLGVFAEFRQEMDAAVRSYESGYEGLLGPDVLETIASWSPRWNEARLLADVFAIRILRCLLWNGNYTAAVRRWQLHRERIKDFVDRRGKGSATYSWEAWEARWALVMAEMIQKVSISDFAKLTIYLPVERSITIGERMQPWEYLHHPGYWYRAASKHLMARRNLALTIPEEDRSPPGSSAASQVAGKSYTYDTYLCPGPHEEYPLPGYKGINHSQLIVACLGSAVQEYEKRGQYRLSQELQLLSANECIKQEFWEGAIRILRPLWQKMSYREEGWWNAVEEVGWALRKAAANLGDGSSVVSVDWELLNKSFTYHSKWHYDLLKSLDGLENVKSRPAVILHEKDVHSFISATYTFQLAEAKVGEACLSQLAVISNAFSSAAPVTLSEIKLVFSGSLKSIVLKHIKSSQQQDHASEEVVLNKIMLKEFNENGKSTLIGEAYLTFLPSQTRVFEFSSIPREAGDAKATAATFSMNTQLFDLEYVQNFERSGSLDIWWGEKQFKRLVRVNGASALTILPKPPKLELRFLGRQEQYYTNEQIVLKLEVVNGEEDDSLVSLGCSLKNGASSIVPTITIVGDNKSRNANSDLDGTQLGRIATSKSTMVEILVPPLDIPAIYEISLKATYNLVSDIETPVYRSLNVQLEVINPFEANYDFSPRIHPDPWPSLFTHDEEEDVVDLKPEGIIARGLAQRWCLTARYASFAADQLLVEDVDIFILGMNGGIQCHTKKLSTIANGGLRVAPKTLEEALFDVSTQKLSLDDRGTATLDISLAIKWRRTEGGSAVNTSTLAVPRLLVSSSEPRVLASVAYSSKIPSMIHFDVTIENPSNHFLTFGVTMEPSEKFAFSGVKQSTLQLVPLSRRTISFRLLPSVRGEWIGPIHCVIRDRYFQKVLKIAPTEGMKVDKDGILVWVPPEDETDQ